MACARFYPEMYHMFLKGKITIPTEEERENLSSSELTRKYPHYNLFMAVSLGQAFSDGSIQANVEIISKIPTEELLSLIGKNQAGADVFLISYKDLSDKYGVYLGDQVWD